MRAQQAGRHSSPVARRIFADRSLYFKLRIASPAPAPAKRLKNIPVMPS